MTCFEKFRPQQLSIINYGLFQGTDLEVWIDAEAVVVRMAEDLSGLLFKKLISCRLTFNRIEFIFLKIFRVPLRPPDVLVSLAWTSELLKGI